FGLPKTSTPIRRASLSCCARAARGQAAAPPIALRNALRRIRLPKIGTRREYRAFGFVKGQRCRIRPSTDTWSSDPAKVPQAPTRGLTATFDVDQEIHKVLVAANWRFGGGY